MQVYVSHLVSDEKMKKILDNYPVGIESIEFSMAQSLDNLEESILRYKQRMGKYIHTRPLSLHGPFLDMNPMSFDKKIVKATRERYEQAYEAAVKLHADRLVFHSCFLPKVSIEEGWAERMIDFFEDFMKDKKSKVYVHLENAYDPHCRMIKQIIKEINRPDFCACLDVGHVNVSSIYPLEDWFDVLDKDIGHFHIHDNMGIKDSHLAIGAGNVNSRLVMKKFNEEYKHASVTIENSNFEDIIISLNYLRANGIL